MACIRRQKAITMSAKPVPGECTLAWNHDFGAMRGTTDSHRLSNASHSSPVRTNGWQTRSVKKWLEVELSMKTGPERRWTSGCHGHHFSSAKNWRSWADSHRCCNPPGTRLLCRSHCRRLISWGALSICFEVSKWLHLRNLNLWSDDLDQSI